MENTYWINNPIGQKVGEFTASPNGASRAFRVECNRLGIQIGLCTWCIKPVLSYEVEITDSALAMVKQ